MDRNLEVLQRPDWLLRGRYPIQLTSLPAYTEEAVWASNRQPTAQMRKWETSTERCRQLSASQRIAHSCWLASKVLLEFSLPLIYAVPTGQAGQLSSRIQVTTMWAGRINFDELLGGSNLNASLLKSILVVPGSGAGAWRPFSRGPPIDPGMKDHE